MRMIKDRIRAEGRAEEGVHGCVVRRFADADYGV
jgi:hypothetical protein